MKVQIITSQSNFTDFFKSLGYAVNDYSSPRSFDDYDLNIIDMTHAGFWNLLDIGNANDVSSDIVDICNICKTSTKSKILILLPQNITCAYLHSYDLYTIKDEMKKIINILINFFPDYLVNNNPFQPLLDIYPERTVTKINNIIYEASFRLDGCLLPVTKSENSEKITTGSIDNLFLSTLDVKLNEENVTTLVNLLIGEEKEDSELPDWLKGYPILDDAELNKQKCDQKSKISSAEKEIIKIDKKLSENERIKSILYLNEDKLVKIIFEMLETIFDYDLSTFEDKHEEDFRIIKSDVTFIGEIKGLTSNVRSENIGQLDDHCNSYRERISKEGKEEFVKGILLISPERTKPITKRHEVQKKQIDNAKIDGNIIITTEEFIKMYECVINNRVSSKQYIDYLKNNSGLFKNSDVISE